MTESSAAKEIAKGERFAFGANWSRFLGALSDERIRRAEKSLSDVLERERLDGMRFLDIGSGSGLFSLAARRLGASVHSFDFDPQSVACTSELRRRYFADDSQWTVEQGSALDSRYLASLGRFDVVYSWGVLHHTGNMWEAMDNLIPNVADDGLLYIALYNDQGHKSRRWARIKRLYNAYPWLRPVLLSYGFVRAWWVSLLLDLYHLKPFASWREYHQVRGMSPWWDVVDWIGGWPFEVATPEAVFRFYRDRGFQLQNMITRQGYGCNEFVFKKNAT